MWRPDWSWYGREKADAGKTRDFLPADKQYLMTRGVPCLRRATALQYTDEDEDAERLVTFGDLSSTGKEEDEWVETHAGRPVTHESGANGGDIDEIPDVDEHLSGAMANTSLSSAKDGEPDEIPDIDEIPDMEEEGLEDEDDAAAAPKVASPAAGVIDGRCASSLRFCILTHSKMPCSEVEVAKGNLLQVRTYDVLISYDKYYQTPRLWLIGYDEVCLAPRSQHTSV